MSYDLFKPEFRHLVAIGYMGNDAYGGIAGVANGSGQEVRSVLRRWPETGSEPVDAMRGD